MTDFSPDAVARAVLLAELAKADEQIVNAEKSMLHATICFGAARATIANVRAALAQPRKPFRKLALAGPRFDLLQSSGKPDDEAIESAYVNHEPEADDGP